jgi:1-pyrroline-5-carboxylate dehydrogenase
MPFKNENTHYLATINGEEEEFHERYEAAYISLLECTGDTALDYPNIVGGEEVISEKQYEDICPYNTSLVIGRFQRASEEEVTHGVEVAKSAFNSWSHKGFPLRIEIMERAAELIREEKFELAAAVTLDNGKNRYEAIADVDEAIDFLVFYSDEMRRNHGFCQETNAPFPEEYTKSVMRPFGVWAAVCPFNFPVAITTGMIVGALITGNTVVLKPSSPVPLPVYMVTRLLHRAGVQEDALNFISASGSVVGNALISNPDVSGIVFTGSKAVGYDILSNSVINHPRPVIAEMGGKNPIIVTSKANLDWALDGTMRSAFGFGGQKCSACSRLYLHSDIYDEFITKFVERARALKVGDPSQKDVFMGPVIHQEAYEDFKRHVEMAKRDGVVLAGGEILTEDGLDMGLFVQPTIVTELPEDHFLVKNELFLPFVCVQRFETLEEALDKANDVEYGLTAGIFSDSEEEIEYFFKHIQAGAVYSNRIRGGTTGAMVGGQPFGGWKSSGSTGKGAGGSHYLTQFLREQSRTICEN